MNLIESAPEQPNPIRGMNNNDQDTFMQHLQIIRASLIYVVQSAEVSVLVNCESYEPRTSLPDALSAIQSAIDAWTDCLNE